jgi:serine/threonine-protein kinase
MAGQLPPGAYATGMSLGGQYQRPQGHQPPLQSHVETALSLPRPDPASLWMLQQDSNSRVQRKNTAILIAVAVLTAVCVAAICALIYFKYRSSAAAVPDDGKKSNVTAPQRSSDAAPGATGPPGTTAAPSPAASATAPNPSAAPSEAASAAPPPSASAGDDTKIAGTPSGPATSKPSQTAPAPASKDVGYLTVICKPFCDSVKRNGTPLGSSPIVKSPTPPGQYRITLSRAGSPDRVESVIVATGETAIVRATMK